MFVLYLLYLFSNDHLGISVSKAYNIYIPALMISLTLTKSKLVKRTCRFKDKASEAKEPNAHIPEASISEDTLLNEDWVPTMKEYLNQFSRITFGNMIRSYLQ